MLLSLPNRSLPTSNLFFLKFIKLLWSSTVASISKLLLKCFSYCIRLLPFLISPIALLSGTTNFFHHSETLEKTQHFVLKMCSHEWNSHYLSLFSTFNLSSLSTWCSISKLCLPYKTTNNLLYTPTYIFIRKSPSSHTSSHQVILSPFPSLLLASSVLQN